MKKECMRIIKAIEYSTEHSISVKAATLILSDEEGNATTSQKVKYIDHQLEMIENNIEDIECLLISQKKKCDEAERIYKMRVIQTEQCPNVRFLLDRSLKKYELEKKKEKDIIATLDSTKKQRDEIFDARIEVRDDTPLMFKEKSMMRLIYNELIADGCNSIGKRELDKDEYCIEFVPSVYTRIMNENFRAADSLTISLKILSENEYDNKKQIREISAKIAEHKKLASIYGSMKPEYYPTIVVDMLCRFQRRRLFRNIHNLKEVRLGKDRVYVIAKKDNSKSDEGKFNLCIAMDMDYDYCVNHIGDSIRKNTLLVTDGECVPIYKFSKDRATNIKNQIYGHQGKKVNLEE